jgi:hypothetical protein
MDVCRWIWETTPDTMDNFLRSRACRLEPGRGRYKTNNIPGSVMYHDCYSLARYNETKQDDSSISEMHNDSESVGDLDFK